MLQVVERAAFVDYMCQQGWYVFNSVFLVQTYLEMAQELVVDENILLQTLGMYAVLSLSSSLSCPRLRLVAWHSGQW